MACVESIGKVKLNLDYYSGRDLYSDGAVEDELLNIVKNHNEESFNELITKSRDWAVMYHLSHIRQNIMGIIDLDKSMKVLEVGSGCGAITGTLSERAKSVTCIELSKKRSTINAYRNQNRDNIEIMVGNFQDIEKNLGKYDCITLIGVFEYADAYIADGNPYARFLEIIQKHLAPEGRIIMAIENKLGLKYFAGCREDHFGTYFEGIEGYTNTTGVKTFTRRELEELFHSVHMEKYRFYYPYHDYKFPMKVFSDRYLPKIGEMNANFHNYDRDRMYLFDESKAFNTVIQEGLFPLYTNSFLVEIGRDDQKKIYQKFSNDRAVEFAVYTDMIEENGAVKVRKYGATAQSREHIANILKWSEELKAQYRGSKLTVCESVANGEFAECEFLTGKTLEEVADSHIRAGEPEKAAALIKELMAIILEKNTGRDFVVTPEFTQVFGEVEFEQVMHTGAVNDIDMVLNNIILDGEAWKLIDYEWTFAFPVPVEFIQYRILHYYLETNQNRTMLKQESFLTISEKDSRTFARMEQNFQNYVKGERSAMRDLYQLIGKNVIDVQSVVSSVSKTVKLYRDYGEDYSEERAISCQSFPEADGKYSFTFSVEAGVQKYRWDPCENGCILKLKKIVADDGRELSYQTNGFLLMDGVYIFAADPWIEFEVADTGILTISIEYSLEDGIPECHEELVKRLTPEASGLKQKLKQRMEKLHS